MVGVMATVFVAAVAASSSGVLHVREPLLGPVLLGIVFWSAVLLVPAGAVLFRRKSRPAGLLALALAALLARLLVGVLAARTVLTVGTHRSVEHALAAAAVLCVLGAAWAERSTRRGHA